jgi:hypothetical protein
VAVAVSVGEAKGVLEEDSKEEDVVDDTGEIMEAPSGPGCGLTVLLIGFCPGADRWALVVIDEGGVLVVSNKAVVGLSANGSGSRASQADAWTASHLRQAHASLVISQVL